MDGETTGSNIEWSTSCVETMVFDFGIQFFCHREIIEIKKKLKFFIDFNKRYDFIKLLDLNKILAWLFMTLSKRL